MTITVWGTAECTDLVFLFKRVVTVVDTHPATVPVPLCVLCPSCWSIIPNVFIVCYLLKAFLLFACRGLLFIRTVLRVHVSKASDQCFSFVTAVT